MNEHDVSPEFPKLPIYYVPERLDFIETDTLADLRRDIVTSMQQNGGDTKELVGAYLHDATDVIENQPPHDQQKARVGLSIALALMQRDAGHGGEEYRPERIRNYVEDLEEALAELDGIIVRHKELEEDTTQLEETYRTICQAHDDELDDYDRRQAPTA